MAFSGYNMGRSPAGFRRRGQSQGFGFPGVNIQLVLQQPSPGLHQQMGTIQLSMVGGCNSNAPADIGPPQPESEILQQELTCPVLDFAQAGVTTVATSEELLGEIVDVPYISYN